MADAEGVLRLQETISRLREALASMNKDYMQTKLELDEVNGSKQQQQQQQQPQQDKGAPLGAQLLKFSSKMKAFQSNLNTKLATAIEKEKETEIWTKEESHSTGHDSETVEREREEERRLKDNIESLETQITNYRQMLEHSMEEKDIISKERKELLIKYSEADQQIKRLKKQSIDDSNRYEQLLDSFRADQQSISDTEKKKLYKECDEKILLQSIANQALKEQCKEVQIKLDQSEEKWNDKFDLVVTERNSLKRKVKSLQNSLSHSLTQSQSQSQSQPQTNGDNSNDVYLYEEMQSKFEKERNALLKEHNIEKCTLLNTIKRLSSKSSIHSKGSDMQFLVNSLSNLITEKEDIIESLTLSKKYLGHKVLELEQTINQMKQ